jgi:exopolysaccharide biosynthesis predicted pyruvyltransferase EpsI
MRIKAKLEAVEDESASFDEEFLAYLVLPNGQTVGDTALPGIENAYLTHEMPKLLPAL